MSRTKVNINEENNELRSLKNDFLRALSNSDSMVYQIREFEIKDNLGDKPSTNKVDYNAYALDEVEVFKTDFQTKTGYCVVNGSIDIPLRNVGKSDINTTFWNREDCVAVIRSLNDAVLSKIESDMEEIAAAKNFLSRVMDNNHN
jgi:hypothetical protein